MAVNCILDKLHDKASSILCSCILLNIVVCNGNGNSNSNSNSNSNRGIEVYIHTENNSFIKFLVYEI